MRGDAAPKAECVVADGDRSLAGGIFGGVTAGIPPDKMATAVRAFPATENRGPSADVRHIQAQS